MKPTLHLLLWILGIADPQTQTTESERACLAKFASGRLNIVEVGVWHGVTSCVLRRAMASNGTLHCVDPFTAGRLRFNQQQIIAKRNVGRACRNGNVRWHRMTGVEAAEQSRSRNSGEPWVDFIFIDGDHSYDGLRQDWEAWSGLVRSGGIVALHDSRSSDTRSIEDAGSVKYTSEVISHDPLYKLACSVDTLSIFERQKHDNGEYIEDRI